MRCELGRLVQMDRVTVMYGSMENQTRTLNAGYGALALTFSII